MDKTAFVINGQTITWPMYGKVIRCCRGDRHIANLIFYRAKVSGKPNVMGWIAEGLKRPKDGTLPYACKACRDELDNKRAVEDWIDTVILKLTPQKAGDIMQDMVQAMAQGMRA